MKNATRRDFLKFICAGTAMALLPAGCNLPGCTEDELEKWNVTYKGRARHVIFISLDTARSDHFGCYGNTWIKTPQIDRLADESILFTDCMTAAPTTLASHTSLFTGKYPHHHGTPRNGFMVNKKNIMLTEILKKAGFHTAGFLGSYALESIFDFSQGFDYYNEEFNQLVGIRNADQNQRNAESVTDAVIRYLNTTGIPPHLFLFVHYFDPHAPYAPPSPYAGIYQNNTDHKTWLEQTQNRFNTLNNADVIKAVAYAGEVSYLDYHMGRFIRYLRQKNILDDSILIVTSDHGETFKEHDEYWNHGYTVYQSSMQIMCMMRLPNADNAGSKVGPLFANIDILPTLLTYIDLPVPDNIDGEVFDLEHQRYPSAKGTPIRFGEATKPHKNVETDPRWININKSRCVREGRLKYIHTPYKQTEELYDLSVDPHEQNNLATRVSSSYKRKLQTLKKQLASWTNSANPLPSHFNSTHRDEVVQRLKSLGYLK